MTLGPLGTFRAISPAHRAVVIPGWASKPAARRWQERTEDICRQKTVGRSGPRTFTTVGVGGRVQRRAASSCSEVAIVAPSFRQSS